MTEHKFHQQRERLLFRYTSALEAGDFTTIEAVLQIAQNDPSLGQMVEQINAAYAEEAVPAHFNGHHNPGAFPVDNRFHQQPQSSKSESPTVQPIPMRSSHGATTPSWLTLAAACVSVAAFMLLIVGTMLPESENALKQTIFDRLQPITAANASQLQPVAQVGSGSVTAFAISTDGQKLAVGTSLGIWLHDALAPDATRRKLTDIFVDNLVFSPDDTRLAAVLDGEILMWDTETGELINTYGIDRNNAYQPPVFFAPDGTAIYAASKEVGDCNFEPPATCVGNFIHQITLESDQMKVIQTWQEPLELVAVSPKGDRIAAFYEPEKIIVVYDPAAPSDSYPLATLTGNYSTTISAVFSPDSKYLAVSSGAALIVANGLKNIVVWDLNKREVVNATNVITPIGTTLIAMDSDGETLYYVDRDIPRNMPPELIAWKYQQPSPVKHSYTLPENLSWGGSFVFNPSVGLLVRPNEIGGLMRWQLTTNASSTESTLISLPTIEDYSGFVNQVAFIQGVDSLLTTTFGAFEIWEFAENPVKRSARIVTSKTSSGALITRDDKSLFAYSSYTTSYISDRTPTINYWDPTGERTKVNHPEETPFFKSVFGMDSGTEDTLVALVIAGGDYPETYVVGAATLTIGDADGAASSFVKFDLPTEHKRLVNAEFGQVAGGISTESGLAVLGGCLDKGYASGLQRCEPNEQFPLMVFDINTGELLYQVESQLYPTNYYIPLHISLFTDPSTGQTLLAAHGCGQQPNCGTTGVLKVWDVTDTKKGDEPALLHQFQTLNGVEGSMSFSADGKLLAHVGRFGDLQVFDMTSGETLFEEPTQNQTKFLGGSIAFNQDNTLLAVGSLGYATLWGIPAE